jgi:hypothetical protein
MLRPEEVLAKDLKLIELPMSTNLSTLKLPPMLQVCLMESDEPSCIQSKAENLPFTKNSPAMEKVLPNLTAFLTDTDEPNCINWNTLSDDPRRVKLRAEKLDPTFMKSTTESLKHEPNLARPQTDIFEPRRNIDLTERLELADT